MSGSINRSRYRRTAHLASAAIALLLAVRPLAAQLPPVGIIDFYGLRTLAPADLVGALKLQIGDSLTEPVAALRARLLDVPGVEDAAVNAVCCESGRSIVYVGIREQGTRAIDFAEPPDGAVRLPNGIVDAGDRFLDAMFEGVRRGESAEDDSAGHAVVQYPPARAVQQTLIGYAADHTAELRAVLRNSSSERHRALAAQVIAYTPNKKTVVGDLVAAVRDPDAGVRNNAIRALAVMALYDQRHPEAGLDIPYTPFIELLNSLDWTDRNKASFALAALTGTRDASVLKRIREGALDALVEMARWKSLGHAAAAGVILGRIAGLPEDQIFSLLQKNREAVIAAAQQQE